MEDVLAPFEGRRYHLALKTWRRNGRAVMTPVWFTVEDGKVYLRSFRGKGKLKRLRHSPRAAIAPSTFGGRIEGDWVEVEARILDDPAEVERVHQRIGRKYGLARHLFHLYFRLKLGRGEGDLLGIELTPVD